MATLLRRVPNLCRDAAHFSASTRGSRKTELVGGKQADARLQRALDDLEACSSCSFRGCEWQVAQPKLDASEGMSRRT